MKTYVYRLFDADGELLYVGQSRQPNKRLQSHRSKTWGSEIAGITTEEYDTREEALKMEGIAIYNEDPKHNLYGVHWYRWHLKNFPGMFDGPAFEEDDYEPISLD